MSLKTIIYTENAPAPIGPYSQAVKAGNTLYVSGQIAIDPVTGELTGGDVAEQAKRVMKNVEAVVTAAGYTMADIVKTSIFLTDMNDFAAVNEIYGSFFTADFPARETVQVSALPKGVNVEVSVIAVKD